MAKANAAEDSPSVQQGLTRFESRLLNLMALRLVHERQQSEQVDLLSRAGFRPVEIAALLDTSPNNVSVRLVEIRKAKKRMKKIAKKK